MGIAGTRQNDTEDPVRQRRTDADCAVLAKAAINTRSPAPACLKDRPMEWMQRRRRNGGQIV